MNVGFTPISKQLIELMKGKIWVESDFGVGTTFHFTIRLNRKSDEIKHKYTIPDEIKNKKVMIIDNLPERHNIIRKSLEFFHFRVTTAKTGPEVQAILAKDYSFTLFFIDTNVPDINVIDLVNQIKAGGKGVSPAIFLIPFGQEDEITDLTTGNHYNTIRKPVSIYSLYEAIIGVYEKKNHSKKISSSVFIVEKYKKKLFGKRILVAEDNLINQEITKAVLEKAGIIVTIANNGKEAVKAIQKDTYELVLMDIQMPEMDGYSATKAIRNLPEFVDFPIIAMTAHAMKGDAEKCFNAGMNGHVTKPISQKILFETITTVLAGFDVAISISHAETNFLNAHKNTMVLIWELFRLENFEALLPIIKTFQKNAKEIKERKIVNIINTMISFFELEKSVSITLIESLEHELNIVLQHLSNKNNMVKK